MHHGITVPSYWHLSFIQFNIIKYNTIIKVHWLKFRILIQIRHDAMIRSFQGEYWQTLERKDLIVR